MRSEWTIGQIVALVVVVAIIAFFTSIEANKCAEAGGDFVRIWAGWYQCIGVDD